MRPSGLALLLVALLPVAAGADVRGTAVGGANYYGSGFVVVATDDLMVGTAYDTDPADDGEAYWIVKACYDADAPAVPDFCAREDVYPVLATALP